MNFKVKAQTLDGEDIYSKPEFYIDDVDGVRQVVKNADRGEPTMLEFYIISSLFAMADKADERGNHVLDGPARMEIYELCRKIKAPKKDKDLSRTELEKIKEATGKYLNSVAIMGQIWEVIENASSKEPKPQPEKV